MLQARFELNEYTVRVLDVIKGKFGLKNRNEALNKFFLEYGSELISPKINEEILSELDDITQKHLKKHGYKDMSIKDLDKLLGIKNV